jgi:hypothetical protein
MNVPFMLSSETTIDPSARTRSTIATWPFSPE